MSEPIQNALTREEWDAVYGKEGETFSLRDFLGLSPNAFITRRQRHALAAIMLDGQPFGFTAEDVDALTVLLRWGTFTLAAQPEGRPPTVEEQVRARNAIAKLAALLP